MTTPNNLRLLFLFLSLLFHFVQADDSPSPSPSPVADGSTNVFNAPSPSTMPTKVSNAPSPSPLADGPTKVSNALSPSPVADGTATISNVPSTSAAADGPNSVFDGPSTSPEADDPTADSGDPSLSNEGPTRRSEPTLSPSPEADGATVADLAQFDSGQTLGPSSAASANPKLKEICDSTDHPDLCLATVLPHLDGDSNIPAVLEITIRRSSDLAKVGLTMAKTMSNNSSIPQEQATILNDCKDSYDYAVYNFASALEAFPRRDIDTMRSMLSAVITDVGDCEDGLSRYGEESPFTNVAGKLVNMTSNCLAIVSLLN